MTPRRRIRGEIVIGLILSALAPAPPQEPHPADSLVDAAATPASLARDRAAQGAKTYEMAWLYFTENRIDVDQVYRWSRRAWEADVAAATDQAGRVAAAEAHRERISRLEAKIAKIRQLGFGNSLDVEEVLYYRQEAEYWIASARAR